MLGPGRDSFTAAAALDTTKHWLLNQIIQQIEARGGRKEGPVPDATTDNSVSRVNVCLLKVQSLDADPRHERASELLSTIRPKVNPVNNLRNKYVFRATRN